MTDQTPERRNDEGGAPAGASLPALPRNLLNPATGELLPATPHNAAVVLQSLRRLREQVNDASRLCQDVLAEESRRVGTKTLHVGSLTAEVSGGSELVWDVERLLAGLRDHGCPEERLDELVTTTIEYKVNQAVARQLAGANPDYAKAIEDAKQRVPAPTRVSVKEAR